MASSRSAAAIIPRLIVLIRFSLRFFARFLAHRTTSPVWSNRPRPACLPEPVACAWKGGVSNPAAKRHKENKKGYFLLLFLAGPKDPPVCRAERTPFSNLLAGIVHQERQVFATRPTTVQVYIARWPLSIASLPLSTLLRHQEDRRP